MKIFKTKQAMPTYQTITVHIEHHIATVTLNRADKKNAMTFKMMNELICAAKFLRRQKQVFVVCLRGAGGDFCSGLDIGTLNSPKNIAAALWQLAKPSRSLFQQACLVWRELPMPVIALIDGVCLGAGLQLALAADIRLATPHARFGLLEAKWGLVCDMGLTQTAQTLPSDLLKELMMTAQIIDAKHALQYGLITHICDDLQAQADELMMQLMTRSPDALSAAKRVVNAMYQVRAPLYAEKYWQLRLIFGKNRAVALQKTKDRSVRFVRRYF